VSVSVFVMPLATYLSGTFQVTWGTDGSDPGPRRRGRSPETVERDIEAFLERLERVLSFRPVWGDSGPVRSATLFSLDGFSAPFLQARAGAAFRNFPLLRTLEPPQIWLPLPFDPAIWIKAPWSPATEWAVASVPRLRLELTELLGGLESGETRRVTLRLIEILHQADDCGQPVIVEI
jgi:hypothetical protein